jgi:acid phosphatase type 7
MGCLLGFVALPARRATRLGAVLAVLWAGLVAIPPATAAEAYLVAAGDIASCVSAGDAATAALVALSPGTVATMGDNAYDGGTARQFTNCYGPTWGQFKDRTRPAVGNHEYGTPDAAGHFRYFGAAAGPAGKGWYSYDLGDWHVIVLNSNCSRVACGPGSEQEQWLRADLAAGTHQCTLAYWHHPRFSSDARHGNDTGVAPFWDALYEYGADLVLGGHAHVYERFRPQDPLGRHDPDYGIQQITVGTGGRNHYAFGGVQGHSLVRNADTFGVLHLTLRAGSYDWRFLPEAGKTFTDSGTSTCHGRPGPP